MRHTHTHTHLIIIIIIYILFIYYYYIYIYIYIYIYENTYRVFDGSRNAAYLIGIRRHDVSDHAANKKLAGPGLRQQAGINPGIRAGDEKRVRPLPVCQLLEKILVLRENVFLKSGNASQEFFDGHGLQFLTPAAFRSK